MSSTTVSTPIPDSLLTLELSGPPPAAAEAPARPKYLVCVLYYGAVDREHGRCIEALHKEPFVYDVLELTGCPYIDIGRSIAATVVLDNPAISGLLFIDHDMVFDPKEAAKVIESAEACQGTAGAAYSMRRSGRIIGAIDTTKMEPGKKVVFFDGGESLPAHHLGMGMTAIHRSVFERLVQASEQKYARQRELVAVLQAATEHIPPVHWSEVDDSLKELVRDHLQWKDLPRLGTGISDADCVPFFSNLQLPVPSTPGKEGHYLGEDVSFCMRNHQNGLPVRLDSRARVYHKGTYCYGIEDVGMEVPCFARLEVVDTGNVEAEVKPALFSPNPEVQAALDASFPDGTLTTPSAVPAVEGASA